ncbi:MAG: hypothetical protein JW797_03505 [Bradymonadales bacterium]|nr:hypothetical protein [Bradymonadales bacterium]
MSTPFHAMPSRCHDMLLSFLSIVTVAACVLLHVGCLKSDDGSNGASTDGDDVRLRDVPHDIVADHGDEPAARDPLLRMFVTSEAYDGRLVEGLEIGVEAADAKCNIAAQVAGLEGSYVAYLTPGIFPGQDGELVYSDVLASSRILGEGPWVAVRTDTVIFADRAALDGVELPAYLEIRTEYGEPVTGTTRSDTMVWTGMSREGVPTDSCYGWTTNGNAAGQCGCLGEVSPSSSAWRECPTILGACICYNTARLYCFERPE